MNIGRLQAWALVAEIVGGVAVIVSLIYVGIGVRQNTAAMMVANHQAVIAMDLDKNAWFRDPEFAALYERALAGTDELTPGQNRQVRTFIADTLNGWEFSYLTHADGMMNETLWLGWDSFYRRNMQDEPFRRFWRQGRDNFSPAFAAYVDSVLPE